MPNDSVDSARRSPDRDRRVWSGWVRVGLSLVAVLVFFKIYAGWHWSVRIGSGPGVTFSPTNAYVGLSSAMSLVVGFLSEVLEKLLAFLPPTWFSVHWRLAYSLGTVFPAALIGVLVYAMLTRRFGRVAVGDGESHCRRCNYILNGLSKPRCPECGEGI